MAAVAAAAAATAAAWGMHTCFLQCDLSLRNSRRICFSSLHSSALRHQTGRFTDLRIRSSSTQGSVEVLSIDGGGLDEAPLCAALTAPFHLAIPVHDIHAARSFFGGVLGCPEGRSAKTWVDFNLYGHQVVCHEVQNYNAATSANAVDGDPVPVPHFGLAMSVPDFHALAERVKAAGIKFVIEPHIRFVGQPGEQWTMFFKDYSGNAIEFKAMTTPSNLFAKYTVE